MNVTTPIRIQRRNLLMFAAVFAMPAAGWAATLPLVNVWKTPSCGCCKDWVAHLQVNGFSVKTIDVSESAKAAQRLALGMPEKWGSCHTALVQGYVLEGHVPAREIQRLLLERPRALGLAVPGMPVGSPGMDGPVYAGRKDPYAVLLVQRDGTSTVFQSYPG